MIVRIPPEVRARGFYWKAGVPGAAVALRMYKPSDKKSYRGMPVAEPVLRIIHRWKHSDYEVAAYGKRKAFVAIDGIKTLEEAKQIAETLVSVGVV